MQVYGFSNRETAVRLREIAGMPDLRPEPTVSNRGVAWLFQSPAAGIPAFDGYAAPTAEALVPTARCRCWLLYPDGDQARIRPAIADDGEPLEMLVANLAPHEIPPNQLMRATAVAGGMLLVDWLPCDGS